MSDDESLIANKASSKKVQPIVPTSIMPLYIFRLLHILSIMGISYKTINDYIRGVVTTQYSSIFGIAGVALMISGLVNTFLLQPKRMGQKRKLWVGWNHLKLVITVVLFSPIYKFIPGLAESLTTVRFAWLIITGFVSPAARFYREYYVKQNQTTKRA